MESKVFKDISMTFETNPLTDDLIALKNTTAIVRSIKNIIFTVPGTKFFNPSYGCKITASLFETLDSINANIIEDEIKLSIGKYESRVNLIKVKVSSDFDENVFNVSLQYEVIGVGIPPQQLEFVLLPSR